MVVDVRLLGGFELAIDGQAVPANSWRRRQASVLIKLLAMEPEHRLHRERVMDALWPDLPLSEAAPRLHKSAHFARAATGRSDAIVIRGEIVALFPDDEVVVDAARFDALARAAEAGAEVSLDDALVLYRGDLLPDDLYEPWLEEPREQLRLRHLTLLRAAQRWQEVVAADPGDEDAHLRLVRILVDRGDRAGALQRLDFMEAAVRRALDVEPSPAAIELREAALALPIEAPAPGGDDVGLERLATVAPTPLPLPLTPFIGRVRELADLVAAARSHRLVTAAGPGGVGKTRLALAAADLLQHELRDRAVFVDLMSVTSPENVVAAMADAVGAPERAGSDREAGMLRALTGRQQLIVLDNCEHVVDAVRVAVERVLSACPDVRVLATSRLRLMLPFEHVYTVPGLDADGRDADAVELFVTRMVAAGASEPGVEAEWEAVQRICLALNGMALAIELAAARAPSLGLVGLEQSLGSQLSVLTGGRRADHRHASLRATIDWSYELLADEERALLRAASVFAAPFDVPSLAAVMDHAPAELLDALAGLVDWNLVIPRPGGTRRYGVLETIRQYGTARADEGGELDRLRTRHLQWVRSALEGLLARLPADDAWCAELDLVLDDARSASSWAAREPARRDASELAALLARATFQRGHPGEAQRHYEDAAAWATEAVDRHRLLCLAAGAATTRNVGVDAVEILQRASALAIDAGYPALAAQDLAHAVMIQRRASGIVARSPNHAEVDAMLQQARKLGTGDAGADAVIALADGWAPEASARSRAAAADALALARAVGDPLLEDTGLDQLIVVELDDGDLEAAVAAVRARVVLMAAVPVDAASGFELYDTHQMGCILNLAAGDFAAARQSAAALASLAFLREQRHLAVSRRLEIEALAGEFDTALRLGSLFEQDWLRAGRPVASNLLPSALSVAMVHGVLGDAALRRHWLDIAEALVPPDRDGLWRTSGFAPVVAAIVALHDGEFDEAMRLTATDLDDEASWRNPNRRVWLSWYAAMWAEAGVLSGHATAGERVQRATEAARGNAVAAAIVARAAAIHRGAPDELAALTPVFEALGAVYQAARTDVLAGR